MLVVTFVQVFMGVCMLVFVAVFFFTVGMLVCMGMHMFVFMLSFHIPSIYGRIS
jgi:hypothetical protein